MFCFPACGINKLMPLLSVSLVVNSASSRDGHKTGYFSPLYLTQTHWFTKLFWRVRRRK